MIARLLARLPLPGQPRQPARASPAPHLWAAHKGNSGLGPGIRKAQPLASSVTSDKANALSEPQNAHLYKAVGKLASSAPEAKTWHALETSFPLLSPEQELMVSCFSFILEIQFFF